MIYVFLLNPGLMKILILKLMVIHALIFIENLNIKGLKETAVELLYM
jgi:hypothetical protein